MSIYPNKLDTLLCFNLAKNKFITSILFQCDQKDCTQDDIWYFYGVNIDKKWYFFQGPSLVIPREKGRPTPFFELHAIAMDQVFAGYLKKNHKGDWEINEKFFDRIEFQYQKWGYWDKEGKFIDNSILTDAELQALYLNSIIYNKYKQYTTLN